MTARAAPGPGDDVRAAAEAAGAAPGPGDDVRVTVNGDDLAVPRGTTVAALLVALDVEPRGVAVAVDGEVTPRRTWADRSLAPGERVEILSVAQGG